MRNAIIERKTAETDIKLSLDLDGKGAGIIDTGVGFLDHMLTLFAKHGRFDLNVKCVGDTDVDFHHSVEDIGIALGKAFAQALGDKAGICRYGDIILPMDEALILAAIDISGRDFLNFDVEFTADKIGDFDTELVEEFWYGFVRNAAVTLHFKELDGQNNHHVAEGCFKAAGRAMRKAVSIDPRLAGEIPSTKGVL
ncbi:MAG: imidazoleglycerol-phosphate dehydratase HisB [Clostridia bacterium]|nr:imidazoleglycerol-phosphate dehydratase HisB [Clostridia bacterium]